ncbi:uncharacterized protein LOC113516024 [Galleria mellonella]|uniref:Uncharacterized protein LOC113516024 n=1 Tax=Galleria mellonella TaxID=7137 RepID=A0A6J1WUB3_GALME|nr:uncharacterized protein LOC113516024 [Galleria mellonella]
MVLLGTINLFSAIGARKGSKESAALIKAHDNLTLHNIFFNLCQACELKIMASIPPSAFSAGRIRDTQRNRGDMKLKTNVTKSNEKYFNTTFKELSPLKYNSKLMNSIWGFYNRYSPHNVKKVNDAHAFNGELQPSAVSSGSKSEPMITLPSTKLDQVWATINASQSQ